MLPRTLVRLPAHRLLAAALLLLLPALPAPASAAEPLELVPRYEAGDVYTLSLRTATKTEGRSSKGGGKSLDEDVEISYEARVEVLEAQDGVPVREMHRGARLTFERPDESGSLFGDDPAAYEVRRAGDGVELFVDGSRVPPAVERAVAGALTNQFERGGAPELFAPGRPVAPGDSWELDPERARAFLETRGIRVLELGEPATARLAEETAADGPTRVVRYRIPLARFELVEMPPNSRASASEGLVEGEIRLRADGSGGLLEHTSELEIGVKGVSSLPGTAGLGSTSSWRIDTARTTHQRSVVGSPAAAE